MFKLAILLSTLIAALSISPCSAAQKAESELDKIISPEIYHDSFYKAIYKMAMKENISTILEIGSSNGCGSTDAFVKGIAKNPRNPTLFCMEVSKVRYEALKDLYKDNPLVKCYNVSSVPLSTFPSEEEVIEFYRSTKTKLNQYELEQVLGWLRQDIAYVEDSGVSQDGIEIIKAENGITDFDMVLIDGSEFTGMAELNLVYGAKFILLDDICTFKNYFNYHRLLIDEDYKLVSKKLSLRNGYAIFKRKE